VSGASLPGLDLLALGRYLDQTTPRLTTGALSGRLLAGGRSNLTYYVTDGDRETVLRRPPLGHVLASAHDMRREYRVLSALADSAVPVPRPRLLVEDLAIIGAPFYLMDWVDGAIYRDLADAETLTHVEKRTVADGLVDVLAELHRIDPVAVGLGDFGRPNGYLTRQLRRWWAQLEQSSSRPLAGIGDLHARLVESIPPSSRAGIVHGDFRLDNLLIGTDQTILAILDWEMATLGDPLTDLGLMLVYWDGLSSFDNPITTSMGARAGFPDGAALVSRYADRVGADLSRLDWYVAFGYFKLAVICEGIHYRYLHGQTVGAGFDKIGELVGPLIELGNTTLANERHSADTEASI
jgi:aminoglycoside phosphotransferase (APT) family kinase protein